MSDSMNPKSLKYKRADELRRGDVVLDADDKPVRLTADPKLGMNIFSQGPCVYLEHTGGDGWSTLLASTEIALAP